MTKQTINGGMTTASYFNGRWPIGSKFNYYRLKGSDQYTPVTTRSRAWATPSGSALVKVTGIAGGVDVSHLEPRT